VDGASAELSGSHVAAATYASTLLAFMSDLPKRLYVLYVPMFFALSGYLVASSAIRINRVGKFLEFRVLRILPALTFEATLSALVLGPFFTTLPLSEYLMNSQFLRYFGNLIGLVTYHLPGVFEGNPEAGFVNVNLWTLPLEFSCYLCLATLLLFGMFKRTRMLGAIFATISVALLVLSIGFGIGYAGKICPAPVVIFHFAVGSAFFVWRGRIPFHPAIFLVCVAAVLVLLPQPQYRFLSAFPATYVTIFLGYVKHMEMKFIKGRDYSYGIYLYGFPITQALIASMPGIGRSSLVVLGLTATVMVSMFSWHFVEKPFLGLKKAKAVQQALPDPASS
jgi:peptidoglycan/LPS O-acetylase OafA/YrhL